MVRSRAVAVRSLAVAAASWSGGSRGAASEGQRRKPGWAGSDQIGQWIDVDAIDPQAEVEAAGMAGGEPAEPGAGDHPLTGGDDRTVERADGHHPWRPRR
jgi:hypothetical protein